MLEFVYFLAQATQINLRIRCSAMSLRMPDHLGETIHHFVFGVQSRTGLL